MMDPTDRYQLAQDLCRHMAEHYPQELLVGGVYGSTARGTDTSWSDLELWFVVQDGCPARGQHLIFQGTAAGYRVYERSALEAILTHPSERWPFHMGVLSVIQVLQGDPALIDTWLAMGQDVPEDRFHMALEELAPGLVTESYGRVHSSYVRGEVDDMIPAALEVLFELRTALCLVNRRWCTHDYYAGLADTFSFSQLPEGYTELVPRLYRARRPDEILALADRLVDSYERFLVGMGIQVRDYVKVSEIPV